MKKVRIGVVIPTHWSFMMGGAQYQVKQITDRLLDIPGTEVYIFAKRFDVDQQINRYTIVSTDSGLPVRAANGTLLDSVALWRALNRVRPDVLYQRVGGAYTGVCGFYSERRQCPFVWHVAHDYDVTRGRFAGEGSRPVVVAEKKMLEYGMKRASLIICQTETQVSCIREHYGMTNTVKIPNATPVSAFPQARSGPVCVAWVANLKRWKHPEMFISLARRFSDQQGVKFVMAGKASQDRRWQSILQKEVDATPNLEYVGELTQDEVNALLEQCHIFVNTSSAEGFPNTFLQAWMRGVPVVSLGFDPDGILAGGTVGFAGHSLDDLYESVWRLATDSELRECFSASARELARLDHGPANFDRIASVIVASGSTGRSFG